MPRNKVIDGFKVCAGCTVTLLGHAKEKETTLLRAIAYLDAQFRA